MWATPMKIIRRASLPVSFGFYFVADKNQAWEQKLHKDYREWYSAHEDYRRAVKLVSKVQSDKMQLTSRSVEDNLYKIESPQIIMKAVKDVRSSYRGINKQMVVDMIVHENQALKSDILPHGAVSEDDVTALDNSDTSVEEREYILRVHVGLKQNYKAFAIAMASSKEAIARDKMLTTLHEKPFTLITDNENYLLWNTRYLFWCSLLCGLGGVTWVAVAEREALLKGIVAAMASK